jgi:hypothetical protein
MQYQITNHLSQEQVNLLKGLEGSILNRIFLDDAGEFALSVVIDNSNVKLIIKNIPTVQLDGDEYPKLTVERVTVETQSYKEIIIGQVIKYILIIRDEVTWNNNNHNWYVHSDIGIRVILEDRELLLIAHDSLAGFIKIIEFKKPISDEHKGYEEYWSMKTDILESLKREEINV